jgi:hypothetical protein
MVHCIEELATREIPRMVNHLVAVEKLTLEKFAGISSR